MILQNSYLTNPCALTEKYKEGFQNLVTKCNMCDNVKRCKKKVLAFFIINSIKQIRKPLSIQIVFGLFSEFFGTNKQLEVVMMVVIMMVMMLNCSHKIIDQCPWIEPYWDHYWRLASYKTYKSLGEIFQLSRNLSSGFSSVKLSSSNNH